MLEEIRPNLRRWTARHPEWVAGAAPESPSDWPAEVGCVAYAAADRFVCIDPLVPAGEEREFWQAMDAAIDEHGQPVSVLTTIGFHRRSRDAFVERYGASTSRARNSLPRGVETIPLRGFGETMVWLSEHDALVPGDRLIGDGEGGLRLCPESWLRYLDGKPTLGALRAALRPLRELPVEIVLVSHGEPLLEGAREALGRALDASA